MRYYKLGDLVWYWELGGRLCGVLEAGRLGVVLGAGRATRCGTGSWEEDLVWY